MAVYTLRMTHSTLPIILVSIGLGASVAAVSSHFGFITVFGENKFWVFLVSGISLLISNWYMERRRGQSCPIDPEIARKCQVAQVWNRRVLSFSIIVWIVGFIAAYVALPLRLLIGG